VATGSNKPAKLGRAYHSRQDLAHISLKIA
jgi:hypothetical protein